METPQDQQTGNSQVPRRIRRWALLLRVVILIMILAVVIMDIVSLYIHNGTNTPWFNNFLVVLSVIGVVFSISQLFYLSSFSTFYREPQLFPAAFSSFIASPINSLNPFTEPGHSPMPAEIKTNHRSIVGVLPLTDSKAIVQREKVVKDIYRRLTGSDTTAIVLTGMAGVGKSTLAALVYHYAEKQNLASNSFFAAKPRWFTIDTDVTMVGLAGNLFEALGKPMPDFNHLAPHSQAAALFNLLNATYQPRLIVLDQFEDLLDWQTGRVVADPGISEWLAALNSGKCKCRILFTSRRWPQGTRMHPPVYMQEYHVRGLEIDEGIELLQKQGVKGTEEELHAAVKYCAGHAFALTLLASLLRNQQLSLDALFKDPTSAQLWMGNVARNLLDYIYKRQLSEAEHELLLAFSVYREPIPLEAAQIIVGLTAEVSKAQIQLALETLVIQHLLQLAGEGRYQLHPIVASYARRHFVENDKQASQQALRLAHARAAQFYRQQAARNSPPRERRQHMNDLHPLIEAVWQLCHAEQWQEAYDLLEQEAIFSDLKRWGENTILLELYRLFLPLEKWHPKASQATRILTNLGRIYRTLGQRGRAREYLEQALGICKKEEDRWGEGTVLSFLGRVYADLGQKKTALKYLEQALEIRKEVEDHEGESWTLDNLGEIYDDLGQMERARDYAEQALKIREEVGDRRGIGRTLITLARVYDNLGQAQQARTYLEQALIICKEVKDRTGEALTLNRLGLFYNRQGEREQALKYYEQALSIQKEIGDLGGLIRTLNNLGSLYTRLGQKERALQYLERALNISREVGDSWGEGRILTNLGMAYYDQQQKERALEYLEKALKISLDAGDQRGEGRAQYNLGRVYADLGVKGRALKGFEEAWNIDKRVQNRRGEGWILHNIGLLYFKWHRYNVALASLLLARNIFRELGSPNVFEAENYIGELHEQVGEEQFTALLAQVEPEADQIVEQALREAA